MDSIELQQPPEMYVSWPSGGGFQQIEMRINGQPLVEIIRQYELPHAEDEWDQDIAAGEKAEELGARGGLAGA